MTLTTFISALLCALLLVGALECIGLADYRTRYRHTFDAVETWHSENGSLFQEIG